MTSRVSEHSTKVMSAAGALDERLKTLRKLADYQEEGAVDKIHKRLDDVPGSAGRQVRAAVERCRSRSRLGLPETLSNTLHTTEIY